MPLNNSTSLFGSSASTKLTASFLPSTPIIGLPLQVILGGGFKGIIQFTRTTSGGTKTDVGSPSAAASTSHTYTPVVGDVGTTLGCDIKSIVSPTSTSFANQIISVTVPNPPINLVLSAGAGAVTLAWGNPTSDGGSAITSFNFQLSNGVTASGLVSPITIDTPNDVAVYAIGTATNIIGTSVFSAASNTVTPTSVPGVKRLVATNWRYPTTLDTIANTTETIGRNVHYFGSGDCKNLRLRLPTACNGNAGDVLCGAFTGQFYLEFRGVTKPFFFGGVISRDVASGEVAVISDIIDPAGWGLIAFPVGEKFFIRYKVSRASGSVGMVGGHVMAHDTDNSCYMYNPATVTSASPVTGTGPITVSATANLSPRSLGYSPMPIGEFVNPVGKVSFGLVGASMEDGATDMDWTAPLASGRGLMRATRAADGISNPIAGGCIASSGNSTTAIGGVNTITYDYYQYFTHAEESIGGNDIGSMNGSTTPQKYYDIEKFRRVLWSVMRTNSPGIKIACLLKPPCITASSDVFTSDTGQTVGTEWGMFNGTTVGDTVGLGEYYRTWNVDQLNTAPNTNFTAAINNVIMTVSAMTLPGRRLYIGDTITASGYTGVVIGKNNLTADGTGSYTISPAVPAGLSSRAFTANVTTGTGCDYVFGTEDITFPGRRDLWNLATTRGLGLPNDAALGLPSPTGTGGNHPATNHYWLMSRRLRKDFLGQND